MKLIIGSTALALLLSGASLYAQEPDKEKPKEEPKKEESAKPAPAKKQEPPKQEEKAKPGPAKPQPRPEERNQPARQQDHPVQQQQQQRTDTRSETRTDSRTVQQQHSNNQAHRQPDEKFRAQIGREHHFRVARSEDRRISYGGYYFTYSEAWPSDWDYNDDVYIDYLDGQYYLIDPRHSGVRLLLVVAD